MRFKFIDVARGIAIICIVLGHLGIDRINQFVFTFHVPVFYLVTGFFVNKKTSCNEFISNRFKRLIIPYFITCGFIILCKVILSSIVNPENAVNVAKTWIIAAVYAAGDSYSFPFKITGIGAIWFLWATFWAVSILRVLIDKGIIHRLIVIFVYLVFCNVSRKYIWLPLSIQSGGIALLYMYLGHMIRSLYDRGGFKRIDKNFVYPSLCIMLWVWIEFVIDFQSFWLVHGDYGRGVVDIIGSLCACVWVFLISYFISIKYKGVSEVFSFFGRNSLVMLCMHIFESDVFPWHRFFDIVPRLFSDSAVLPLRILIKFVWIIGMTVVFTRIFRKKSV